MSTAERTHQDNSAQQGHNNHPSDEENVYVEKTPTTPLELPTQPARSLWELVRNRAKVVAAGVATAAVAVGLVALGTSGKETVSGAPTAGQGGEAPAAGSLVPGGENEATAEVVTGNLCDKLPIGDLAEWTTGSRYAFPPKEEIICDGTPPANDDFPMDIVASGTWIFPQTGASSYPVDHISMQIIKDELPDGGSVFERRSGYFPETPHTEEVNGQEFKAVSGSGTTLMNVGDYDVAFTIIMPEGLGGDNPDPSIYDPIHAAEIGAADQLFPKLGLTPQG